MKYGSNIKTAGPFGQNLRQIVEIATRKGDPIVLMTFSFYLPQDYTPEKFNSRSLDYSLHLVPVELWEQPEHVVATISKHNEVVREIAASYDRVIFVDQNRGIPKNGEYFNDIAHLTHKGSQWFVENLVSSLLLSKNVRLLYEQGR